MSRESGGVYSKTFSNTDIGTISSGGAGFYNFEIPEANTGDILKLENISVSDTGSYTGLLSTVVIPAVILVQPFDAAGTAAAPQGVIVLFNPTGAGTTLGAGDTITFTYRHVPKGTYGDA